MNKKMLLVGGLSIMFLIVLVTAVSFSNKNVEISKEYKTALDSIDLSDYNYTDSEQGGLYKRCLHKEICEEIIVGNDTYMDCANVINTCSGWINQNQLGDWEKTRIEGIANATIQRSDKGVITENTKGVTTITEKK